MAEATLVSENSGLSRKTTTYMAFTVTRCACPNRGGSRAALHLMPPPGWADIGRCQHLHSDDTLSKARREAVERPQCILREDVLSGNRVLPGAGEEDLS